MGSAALQTLRTKILASIGGPTQIYFSDHDTWQRHLLCLSQYQIVYFVNRSISINLDDNKVWYMVEISVCSVDHFQSKTMNHLDTSNCFSLL